MGAISTRGSVEIGFVRLERTSLSRQMDTVQVLDVP
jgi:hypothetical protein